MKIRLAFTLVAVILLQSLPLRASEPLALYGWAIGKPIIDQLVPEFKRHTDLDVVYHVIANPYRDNIEQELIYNKSIDVMGLFSPSTSRVNQAQWALDLSQYPELVAVAEGHYEHLRGAVYVEDKLIGLGVAAAIYAVPVIDVERYKALGLEPSELPTNWDDLYDQIVTAAGRGHQNFFLPAWFNDKFGLATSFIAEVMNRGGHLVDPVTASVSMAVDHGAAFETLQDWRRVWTSGAIPPEVLDLDYISNIEAFSQGDYAVGVQANDSFMHGTFFTPEKKRDLTVLARGDQPWGLAIVGLFSQAARELRDDQHAEQIRQLLQWLSVGFDGDEFSVVESWLDSYGYLPVNKAYMRSPRAAALLRKKLATKEDADRLLDIYEHASVAATLWHVQWQEEFIDELSLSLRDFLLDPSVRPSETLTRLNNTIRELRHAYGF